MKNILIISEDSGSNDSQVSFIENIDDIKKEVVKEMIVNTINKIEWKKDGYWADKGMCGSKNYNFEFNDFVLTDKRLPITVEHVLYFTI